jgi:hypothetical protein
VGERLLSPLVVHRQNRRVEPNQAVIPVVHTLYDYNERFLKR